MHSFYHLALQRIYIKTEKGQRELVRPRFGLDSRQRRILMRVDGLIDLRTLAEICPETELEDILAVLIKQDFIVYLTDSGETTLSESDMSGNGKASTIEGVKGKGHILTQSFTRFSAAKELMLEVAVVHLGIFGRDIMQKIEQAESADNLMLLAGRWNMALCESKTANRHAPLYLEKLKLLLFE